jgi:HSP20 family protein
MDIAGVGPEGLSVLLEHGNLIVRGRRCHRPPGEQEEFHLMEIRYGCFERVFRLPGSVVEEDIRASYHDGFLDIEIPKGTGEGKVVNITVRES